MKRTLNIGDMSIRESRYESYRLVQFLETLLDETVDTCPETASDFCQSSACCGDRVGGQ